MGRVNATNSVYTRFGIYELSVGYEKRLNDNIGLGVEADYRPSFTQSSSHNLQWFNGAMAISGARFRALINFYGNTDWDHYSIAPSVRFLNSNTLVHDPGSFSGSNSSYYAEYSQEGIEYGINFIYNSAFASSPFASWYAGLGLFLQYTRRDYIAEGTFWSHPPSNKVEDVRLVYPALLLGFRFRLGRWGGQEQ